MSQQFGTDVAGEVVEVGSNVTRFRAGDRIVGQAVGSDEKQNTSAKGGFQSYTVLLADIASPIPDRMSFENAAVLPLGLVGSDSLLSSLGPYYQVLPCLQFFEHVSPFCL